MHTGPPVCDLTPGSQLGDPPRRLARPPVNRGPHTASCPRALPHSRCSLAPPVGTNACTDVSSSYNESSLDASLSAHRPSRLPAARCLLLPKTTPKCAKASGRLVLAGQHLLTPIPGPARPPASPGWSTSVALGAQWSAAAVTVLSMASGPPVLPAWPPPEASCTEGSSCGVCVSLGVSLRPQPLRHPVTMTPPVPFFTLLTFCPWRPARSPQGWVKQGP